MVRRAGSDSPVREYGANMAAQASGMPAWMHSRVVEALTVNDRVTLTGSNARGSSTSPLVSMGGSGTGALPIVTGQPADFWQIR